MCLTLWYMSALYRILPQLLQEQLTKAALSQRPRQLLLMLLLDPHDRPMEVCCSIRWLHCLSGFSISEGDGTVPDYLCSYCYVVLPFPLSCTYMFYTLFRVRKTPISVATRAKGARRTKPHSKAWMTTPITAVSGAL